MPTTTDATVLTPGQALMFAGYTASEMRASGLSYDDLIALAVAEAADLGALVAVTVADTLQSGVKAAARWAKAVGALFRAAPSRRRAVVDRAGLATGRSKPRCAVLPPEVVAARQATPRKRFAK